MTEDRNTGVGFHPFLNQASYVMANTTQAQHMLCKNVASKPFGID